jgi:hypothetical protein
MSTSTPESAAMPGLVATLVVATFLVATFPVATGAVAAKDSLTLQLPAAARVGVVNLLDAEVTHFHASRRLPESFLKTYPVKWGVNAMLLVAVSGGVTQLGLAVVPLAAGAELSRARESCFLNAELAKGLPKECAGLFARRAAAEHLDAIIVLAPGRNDSAHAAGTRRRELPEYLRGWCFVSGEGGADSAPVLLGFTELLLIAAGPAGVQIFDREWGGEAHSWTGYQPPADLTAIPPEQLDQLQPLFGAMLQQQAGALLGHLQVVR